MVRVLVVGPPRAGKTALVTRMTGTETGWCDDYVATNGTDRYSMVYDGQLLQFWDMGGRERPVPYLGGADVYLLVFDVTRRASFEAIGPWLAALEHAPIIIVGAKADTKHAVSYDDAHALARASRSTYFETSAKTGDGFISLLRHISSRPQVVRLDEAPEPSQSERCYG